MTEKKGKKTQGVPKDATFAPTKKHYDVKVGSKVIQLDNDLYVAVAVQCATRTGRVSPGRVCEELIAPKFLHGVKDAPSEEIVQYIREALTLKKSAGV